MSANLPQKPKSCWVITDGSAGMENQCIGLAEALEVPFDIKRIVTKRPWRWLPPTFWVNPLGQLKPEGDLLLPPWPDLVITCGRQAIPMSMAIRKAGRGKTFTVHIQTPNISATNFDLLVVPEHDRLRGDNVLVSLGSLTRITPEKLEAEKQKFSESLSDLASPVVTVLVGGPNRCYDVTPEVMKDLCQKLDALHQETGCSYLVTTSRRTGADNARMLQETLANLPHILWNGEGDNPYFAYLEKADAVIVTADSVNMVCEAATAGKPVFVFPLPGGNRKFKFFHQSMLEKGYTRPFDGRITLFSPPALAETTRIAALVHKSRELHQTRQG